MKLGIRDLKAKSGRDSGLTVCAGGGLPKTTFGITGVKKPIGDPLRMDSLFSPGLHYRSPVVSRFGKLHKNTELAHAAVIKLDFSRLAVLY